MDFWELIKAVSTPVSVVIALIVFITSQKRNATTDTRAAAKEIAEIAMNVSYIKTCLDELRTTINNHGLEISSLRTEVTKIQCANDALRERVQALEDKK